MSISRRTATINGEKIAFTYDVRTRRVAVPAKGIEFIATCWDAAKTEIAEALAAQAAAAQLAAEPVKRTVLIGRNDGGLVHASRNYKTKCTGKSRDYDIQRSAAAITCHACAAAEAAAATQRQAVATAAATGTQMPNVFVTATLHHELITLADGTYAPKCRARATKGEAVYDERWFISCNSCSGAHRPGTHLG